MTLASRCSSMTYNSCVTSPGSSRCTSSLSSCPLLWFHMRTVPSLAPVSRRRSRVSNTNAVMRLLGCASVNRSSRWPVLTFHTYTSQFSSADTATSNSKLYRQPTTALLWPSDSRDLSTCFHGRSRVVPVTSWRRLGSCSSTAMRSSGRYVFSSSMVWMHRLVRKSQILIVLSVDSEMTWCRLLSTTTLLTLAVCPARLPTLCPVLPCHSMMSRSTPAEMNIEYVLHQSKSYTPLLCSPTVWRTRKEPFAPKFVLTSTTLILESMELEMTALSSGTYMTLVHQSVC
mmetsp:Transcript_17390/g.43020  ORF Transcript_17390/g.43020 Transcript_17390/m.43020 type:complete len:286 (+) Transcript_17390:1849-2706(+)